MVRIEKQRIDSVLATKSTRTQFSRFGREGNFSLDLITDDQAFAQILEDVIAQYNFRHGAVSDAVPFVDDPPGENTNRTDAQRRATQPRCGVVCRLSNSGNQHRARRSRNRLSLHLYSFAVLCQAPAGQAFLLLLQKELAECGIGLLDLTPGAYHWKDAMANDHEETAKLIVYRSSAARSIERSRRTLINIAKKGSQRAGISPVTVKDRIRTIAASLKKIRPDDLASGTVSMIHARTETQIYRHDGLTISGSGASVMQKDALAKLVSFQDVRWWHARQGFLSAAMRQLERGEHVYTYASGGKLLRCCWLADNQPKVALPEVRQEFECP